MAGAVPALLACVALSAPEAGLTLYSATGSFLSLLHCIALHRRKQTWQVLSYS